MLGASCEGHILFCWNRYVARLDFAKLCESKQYPMTFIAGASFLHCDCCEDKVSAYFLKHHKRYETLVWSYGTHTGMRRFLCAKVSAEPSPQLFNKVPRTGLSLTAGKLQQLARGGCCMHKYILYLWMKVESLQEQKVQQTWSCRKYSLASA